MKMTKALAAATTSILIASMLSSTAIAVTNTFNPYYTGEAFDYSLNLDIYSPNNSTSSNSSTSPSIAVNKLPQTLYMTSYTPATSKHADIAHDCIVEANRLLSQMNTDTLNLPTVSLNDIRTISFGKSVYEYLVKTEAEGGSIVLTFNSKESLDVAMTKIMSSEQSVFDDGLKPFVEYVDTVIKSGTYTTVYDTDTSDVKAAKLSNAALLASAKKALTHTYELKELFNADSTDDSKLYQTVYLSFATTGSNFLNSSISNDKVLENFPRLIVDDNVIDWDDISHLDVSKTVNNSWWFAVKDGSTSNNKHYNALSKTYYWLQGMLVPNYASIISFGVDYDNWQQYESYADGSSSSSNTSTSSVGFYYNSSYNYASDYVYVITNGEYTYCYPNQAYADLACANMNGYYLTRIIASTYTKNSQYFCFLTGQFYTSTAASPYPNQTIRVTSTTSNKTDSTDSTEATYYYIHNGYVYDYDNNKIGSVSSRGYSSSKTWFCIDDGKFYSKSTWGHGYYVSTSNTDDVDTSDPNYQYWSKIIAELEERLDKLEKSNKSNNKTEETNTDKSNKTDTKKTDISKTESNKSENNTTKSDTNKSETSTTANPTTVSKYYKTGKNDIFIITASELKDIHDNYKYVQLLSKNNIVWTINSNDIVSAKSTDLRVICNTSNVPTSLCKAIRQRNDANYTGQFTIGENIDWTFTASVRISCKGANANNVAKLYRYDTKSSSLIYVSEAVVDSTGHIVFDGINHGGDYIMTLQ